MKLPLSLAVIMPATLLLQACSAPAGYPSLAIRDSERVGMTMTAPDTPTFVPAPIPPATLENLDALAASAMAAHERFLSAKGTAEAPVSHAAGAAVGSEEWAVAQVEIAALESLRSDTMLALAEIDRIFVDSVVDGADFAAASQTRDEIALLVDEQDQIISAFLASLGS